MMRAAAAIMTHFASLSLIKAALLSGDQVFNHAGS
jgi:hypothetical protein